MKSIKKTPHAKTGKDKQHSQKTNESKTFASNPPSQRTKHSDKNTTRKDIHTSYTTRSVNKERRKVSAGGGSTQIDDGMKVKVQNV